MHCKLSPYRFLVLFLFFIVTLQGQELSNEPKKDSIVAPSPEYLPVYTAKIKQHFFYPLQYVPIDTQMVEVNHYSPTQKTNNIYQTLGIFGQAHQSMIFDFSRSMGFQFIKYPYPLLFKTQDDLVLYKLETSYTKVGYFYGLPNENTLSLNFAQKVKNSIVSLNVSANQNEGYFYHQALQGLVGDAQIQYETPKHQYGFRVSYIINRTENQENNGLVDVNNFRLLDTLRDNKGFPVNSNNAIMQILTHDINWQHYFNITNKKGLYFGTLTHNAQYQYISSSYFDYIDTTAESQVYTFASDTTFDTLKCYKIVNSIQWSNFSPMASLIQNDNFIKFAFGMMHEYFEDRRTYYHFHSFTPFVRGSIRVLKFLDIYGNFSYAFGGYVHNDAIANLNGEWVVNRKLNFMIGVHTDFYRISPDYIYSHFNSNYFQWDTTFKKQNIAVLGAYLKIKEYKLSTKIFLLDNLVILGTDRTPVQLSKFSRLVQFSLYAPYRYKGFGVTSFLALQHATSDSIQVPLFSGKMNVYYIFDIFKRKLKLQLGIDVMYNTSYFANGYSPAQYSFYYQNTMTVGNYWYIDANATVRISRLYFFARIGNLFSPLQNYNMFTTPSYPNDDFLFSLGVNWRFHD
jgi:hypothetical protein